MATSTTPWPAPREWDLLGQTVLVIGGSSGIGLETARLARAKGAEVILTARNPDRLHRVGLELGASIAAFDATDFDRLERFFDALSAPIDHVLVTGPGGYSQLGSLANLTTRHAATSTPTCCCPCRSLGTPRARFAREGRCCSWAAPVAAERHRACHATRRSRPHCPR